MAALKLAAEGAARCPCESRGSGALSLRLARERRAVPASRCSAPSGWALVALAETLTQVCGGHVRWQIDEFSEHGRDLGLDKVDRFDFLVTPRPQPERTRADGRESRQGHARRCYSTLLVFRKP